MLSRVGRLEAEFGPTYLANLKRRDPQTEAHFAAYFSSYLATKLWGRLRNRDLADDICQETLVRVLEAVYTKEDLKHPERFGAFVNSVCNNVLLEYWRTRKAAGEAVQLTEQMDGQPDPEAAAQIAEDIAGVRKVLLKLRKRDRDLLRMVYLEELDRHEISKVTRTSADHVRVILYRAKRLLRRFLDETRPRAAA